MKIKIEITCDSAAFGEYPVIEVRRILEKVLLRLESRVHLLPGDNRTLKDINGNTVGFLKIE